MGHQDILGFRCSGQGPIIDDIMARRLDYTGCCVKSLNPR